jgi:hypothetical protein
MNNDGVGFSQAFHASFKSRSSKGCGISMRVSLGLAALQNRDVLLERTVILGQSGRSVWGAWVIDNKTLCDNLKARSILWQELQHGSFAPKVCSVKCAGSR